MIADAVQFVPIEELRDAPLRVTKIGTTGAEKPEQKQLEIALKALEAELKKTKAQAPPPAPMAMAAVDLKQPADCAICIRGEPDNRGAVAPRGVLQVLQSRAPLSIAAGESGRRELAEWLSSPQNPLTARVLVNRVWQQLMGRGLVATVDNFGELGDRPSHPELLEFLATDFVDAGWSIKQTVRRIVLSRSYRLSSQYSEAAWQVDPDNHLHWRHNRRPLTAESIRDAILQASGSLDAAAGGSSVTHLGEQAVTNSPEEARDSKLPTVTARRSVYLPIVRNDLPDELVLFNFADPDVCSGSRPQTIVPAQALWMMNSQFVRQQSEKLATQLLGAGT